MQFLFNIIFHIPLQNNFQTFRTFQLISETKGMFEVLFSPHRHFQHR